MHTYEDVLTRIRADERYRANLDWGKPRRGHPEGTVAAHICELESNLHALRAKLEDAEFWKLAVLIHTHDSFKAEAKQGVPITHPKSHASLARQFLAEFCEDGDLHNMVQYHDEPYALWRKWRKTGRVDAERLANLQSTIADWNLFLAFLIIDGCTEGKTREPLQWFFGTIADDESARFTIADIL